MKGLLKKEFVSLFYSVTGISFSLSFLTICGVFLWILPGSYNILDTGYTTMNMFFGFAAIILLVLVPALTMRSFAEEKRNNTLSLLLSKPIKIISVVISKILAVWFFAIITISATFVYIIILYSLAIPVGNIDLHEIIANYFSIFAFTFVLTSIGILSSLLTQNQIIALLLSIITGFFLFYGFDLLGSLFDSPQTKATISSFGLFQHYSFMQRGIIQISDIIVFFNYIFLFTYLSVLLLTPYKTLKLWFTPVLFLIAINILISLLPNYRFDFTKDKIYTLNDYTKKKLSRIGKEKKNIEINIFLEGDLNQGFLRLKNSTKDILNDFNRYANNNIIKNFIPPYNLGTSPKDVYDYMAEKGMRGIMLNETNREGKVSQKIIYPYAQIIYDQDTLIVDLLKKITGYTAEETLNASIENLEFQFIDAINILTTKDAQNIAFIEGHNETDDIYLEDAFNLLSKYFFVNKGRILPYTSILDDFTVIIISGPAEKFSEQEKIVLDQYIMGGGSIFWLIDGVYYSEDELKNKGESPIIKNETNLDDMLFNYGVRVNPVLLQDIQSGSILLTSGNNSSVIPFYYSPALIPSRDNIITKNISAVMAPFVSPVDILKKKDNIEKTVLLTTSANTHIVSVPGNITYDITGIQDDPDYFNIPYIPAAIAMEGFFPSAFKNRPVPDSVTVDKPMRYESSKTRMIVAGSSSIIKNQIGGQGDNTYIIPMGYDRFSERQYGNRDFIVNAVNWLAGNDEILSLRNKTQPLRLLNKKLIIESRYKYAIIASFSPVFIMIVIFLSAIFFRRIKYSK